MEILSESHNDPLTPDQTVGGVTLTKNPDKCMSCQNDKTQGSAKVSKGWVSAHSLRLRTDRRNHFKKNSSLL